MGGNNALAQVSAAAMSRDSQMQDSSISVHLLSGGCSKYSIVVRRPLDCGTARKGNRSLCPLDNAENL
jgi:hypothetical protein